MNKYILIIVGAVIAIALAGAPSAEALQAATARPNMNVPTTSLPYIDDVNDWGKGKAMVVLETASRGVPTFKVVDVKSGKKVKTKLLRCHECGKKHIAEVVLKKGREYKVSVRAKLNGKVSRWKSIGYRVY